MKTLAPVKAVIAVACALLIAVSPLSAATGENEEISLSGSAETGALPQKLEALPQDLDGGGIEISNPLPDEFNIETSAVLPSDSKENADDRPADSPKAQSAKKFKAKKTQAAASRQAARARRVSAKGQAENVAADLGEFDGGQKGADAASPVVLGAPSGSAQNPAAHAAPRKAVLEIPKLSRPAPKGICIGDYVKSKRVPKFIRRIRLSSGMLGSIILGVNDALIGQAAWVVGLLGELLQSPKAVVIGGVTVLVVGALNVASSDYLSVEIEQNFDLSQDEAQAQKRSLTKRKLSRLEKLAGLLQDHGLSFEAAQKMLASLPARYHSPLLTRLIKAGNPKNEPPESPTEHGLYTGLSYLLVGMIPIIPFCFFSITHAIIVSVILGGIASFLTGVASSMTNDTSWWKSGLQYLTFYLGNSAAAYLAGLIAAHALTSGGTNPLNWW